MGIEGREDYDYARQIVLGQRAEGREGANLYGFCSVPEVPRYVSLRACSSMIQ